MTLSVERRVGGLVEIRFTTEKVTASEAEQFIRTTRAILADLTVRERRRAVFCMDWRRTGVFPQEVSEPIIGFMRHDNLLVERSGAVGPTGAAVFTLQVQRMFVEAGNPGRRRMFTDPEKLRAWLDEVLEPEERARLQSFLSESDDLRKSEKQPVELRFYGKQRR